jgi:rare lipoprotein A (peptidoglycan hydrolase)
VKDRIIDLSVVAAQELEIMHCGIAKVEVVRLI